MINRLKPVWAYRHFILNAVVSDYRTRIAGSRLGFLWIIVQPLAQALMFAIILSSVLQARLPTSDVPDAYALYLLSGLAAWGLFSEIVTRSTTMFVDNAAVLKKISFPRICLPIVVVSVALINHAILLTCVLVIAIVLGHGVAWPVFALVFVTPLTVALAASLGVVLGVVHVFSRDVGQFMTIAIQVWFWATPIVYPASIVPDSFDILLDINPMTALAGAYQGIVLLQEWPAPSDLAVPATLAVVVGLAAISLFVRASAEVIDTL